MNAFQAKLLQNTEISIDKTQTDKNRGINYRRHMQAAEELQFLSTKLVNSSTDPFYVLYIVKNFQGLDLFPPPPIMDGNKK